VAIDYFMVGTNDLAKSRKFYDAVLPKIGGAFETEYAGITVCYRLRDGKRIWLARPYDKNAAVPGNGSMLGFDAGSEEAVNAAYRAALDNGGSDEGEPGPRPLYGPQFYGGYVRDPDGNKMSFMIMRKAAGKS
jgi:catechol 2,3-dioxygenase-like lactoylglutathione lyase family enzyme